MSVRSTILSTARAARHALPKAQVAPRRAASTAHKGSSNMPWALGSAAVFGSLTAFILMPSGDKVAHAVHENIDAKGAGAHVATGSSTPEHEDEEHSNARDLMRKEKASGDRPGSEPPSKDKPVHSGEDRPRTEIPSKRDDQKPARGPSTGEAFNGRVDQDKEGDKAATKSTGGDKGSDESSESTEKVKEGLASAKESASSAVDKAKASASSLTDKAKAAASSALGSAKGAVGQAKETAESTKDAATSAVGQAKDAVSEKTKSASSGSSDSLTPSNVDDSGKPSDSDIKDSIKQAERSNSPLATMAEEVDESASAKRV